MTSSKIPYWQKLQDPRWQKKRLEIMQRSGFTCEVCCSKSDTLSIHHSYYEKGLDPWEYPDNALHCLCEFDHEQMAEAQRILLRSLFHADPNELVWMATTLNRSCDVGLTVRDCANEIDKEIILRNNQLAIQEDKLEEETVNVC